MSSGGLKSLVGATFNAMVESGNIRYQALPAAEVAVADDAAWDQLFAAAGAPAVPFWLCGFAYNFATNTVLAETTQAVDLGWGGIDGAAVAAANVILTNYPICFSAVAAALGPFGPIYHNLPFPVKIPPLSRMAVRIASSVTGGVAFTSFRVILATVVGS